mmetsp:Transcript_65269/g.202100  ORF Transcript_65269/g.202100 Transcript_65269/m.202100 type:complete len:263 (+) Transcript_65269:691-1479(+)
MPPSVRNVDEVARPELGGEACGLCEARECLQVRLLGGAHHRLAVARMRQRERIEADVVCPWEQADVLTASDLKEQVLSLVKMQRGLNPLHADEELVGVRKTPATCLTHGQQQVPVPRAKLLGHLLMAGEGLLQVHSLWRTIFQQPLAFRQKLAKRPLQLLNWLFECKVPRVLLHVEVAEVFVRGTLHQDLLVLQHLLQIFEFAPLVDIDDLGTFHDHGLLFPGRVHQDVRCMQPVLELDSLDLLVVLRPLCTPRRSYGHGGG